MVTKGLLVLLLVAYFVQPGSFAPRNNREIERNNRENVHKIEKRSPTGGHTFGEENQNNRENERNRVNNRENMETERKKRSPQGPGCKAATVFCETDDECCSGKCNGRIPSLPGGPEFPRVMCT